MHKRPMRLLTPTALLAALLLMLLRLPACAPAIPVPTGGEGYQEMFDKDLFYQRVRLLQSVNMGATEKVVLEALGPPQAREGAPEGGQVFIYRVRCYAGPEPFSLWPRHLSLTSETRITFDRGGRVTATAFKP